ncbi:uncharacterized protein PSFLO_06462 [Pseudozyma flocculosa]|uniref:Uncharacterized protein n=1 Tax=Pseudozyma flocculosa TaxID=84751 RepID=A0A5C3F9T6_9BASI|nr:uncharacterized protein PSFLO_06462 [Pseudozyma flocculosa]
MRQVNEEALGRASKSPVTSAQETAGLFCRSGVFSGRQPVSAIAVPIPLHQSPFSRDCDAQTRSFTLLPSGDPAAKWSRSEGTALASSWPSRTVLAIKQGYKGGTNERRGGRASSECFPSSTGQAQGVAQSCGEQPAAQTAESGGESNRELPTSGPSSEDNSNTCTFRLCLPTRLQLSQDVPWSATVGDQGGERETRATTGEKRDGSSLRRIMGKIGESSRYAAVCAPVLVFLGADNARNERGGGERGCRPTFGKKNEYNVLRTYVVARVQAADGVMPSAATDAVESFSFVAGVPPTWRDSKRTQMRNEEAEWCTTADEAASGSRSPTGWLPKHLNQGVPSSGGDSSEGDSTEGEAAAGDFGSMIRGRKTSGGITPGPQRPWLSLPSRRALPPSFVVLPAVVAKRGRGRHGRLGDGDDRRSGSVPLRSAPPSERRVPYRPASRIVAAPSSALATITCDPAISLRSTAILRQPRPSAMPAASIPPPPPLPPSTNDAADRVWGTSKQSCDPARPRGDVGGGLCGVATAEMLKLGRHQALTVSPPSRTTVFRPRMLPATCCPSGRPSWIWAPFSLPVGFPLGPPQWNHGLCRPVWPARREPPPRDVARAFALPVTSPVPLVSEDLFARFRDGTATSCVREPAAVPR